MAVTRKPPTMADVARLAGVSPMTVSRAFKRDGTVNTETRARVRAAADRLGYVFDRTASNLKSQRTGFVAVTIPSLDNANFAETVGAMSEVLAEHDLQILLASTNYDTGSEERAVEQLLSRRPEALVVTGGVHTDRARRMMESAGIPVVETWDLPPDPIGHVVGFSNAAATREMVGHFVGLGHRRIGFIGGDADRDTRGADRRRGFVAAMADHGLAADRLIAAGVPPVTMARGAEAMAQLLAEWPDTEAVICVSDLSAFGALTECQRRGIAVPGEMSLGGFGAYDISAISWPSITTVDAHARDIGRAAAQLVVDLKGRDAVPGRIEIPPRLLIRETSARP
ncbi:MAG: LacI family DNA-binding transcriptional regulator [Pseudomonadota bacterium]